MENKMKQAIDTLDILHDRFTEMAKKLDEEYHLLLKEGYVLPIRECIGKKLMLFKCIQEIDALKRKYWWN